MAQARRASDECIFMLLGEVIEQGQTLRSLSQADSRKETELYVEGPLWLRGHGYDAETG